MNKILLIPFIFFVFSCSNYSPKPQGYFRIELPERQYTNFEENPHFSFDISSIAIAVKDSEDNKNWFNIVYPDFKATIYCSYLPIAPQFLSEMTEDSRKLVYKHVVKADVISEQIYSNPEYNVYGTIYSLEGDVASPFQFYLTDSVSDFFRASLLFDAVPNQDSIAPVLNFVKEDIIKMIESFRWEK